MKRRSLKSKSFRSGWKGFFANSGFDANCDVRLVSFERVFIVGLTLWMRGRDAGTGC